MASLQRVRVVDESAKFCEAMMRWLVLLGCLACSSPVQVDYEVEVPSPIYGEDQDGKMACTIVPRFNPDREWVGGSITLPWSGWKFSFVREHIEMVMRGELVFRVVLQEWKDREILWEFESIKGVTSGGVDCLVDKP